MKSDSSERRDGAKLEARARSLRNIVKARLISEFCGQGTSRICDISLLAGNCGKVDRTGALCVKAQATGTGGPSRRVSSKGTTCCLEIARVDLARSHVDSLHFEIG